MDPTNFVNNEDQVSNTSVNDWSTFLQLLHINKDVADIDTEDIIGKELPSVKHWEDFYRFYSKLIGFSYRLNSTRVDPDGRIWGRKISCSREGFRKKKSQYDKEQKRQPPAETRCGCKAMIRVNKSKSTNSWVAMDFKASHNHELASPEELRFLRSNRNISDDVVARCMAMKRVGMRNIQILNFIALELGGIDKVPFLDTDLHNKLLRVRRSQEMDQTVTDSGGALGYIQCLATKHGGDFYCVYNVDEENRLCNIFWSDGCSRRDYAAFGEILSFDTTYRTNKYHKPLLILVGANHHWRTIVFGVALMCDETVESFIWVLQMFLDAMNHKLPNAVITDGDNAMKNTITQIFPNAKHRLCGWHILENVGKNVKDINFTQHFTDLMYGYFSEDEFLRRWDALIAAYGLQQNNWINAMFQKRESWAETYLRGNFFAGMRTTQRSESMNNTIRSLLDITKTLTEFVACLDYTVSNMREKERLDDYCTRHTTPFFTPGDILNPYYNHAAKVFTRRIYTKHICPEIQQQHAYSVQSYEDVVDYKMYALFRFPNGDSKHIVRHRRQDNSFKCDCLLFETNGFPCRHIFCVLKYLNITQIPDSLIMKRWTINAKEHLQQHNHNPSIIPPQVLEQTRFSNLNSDFNMLAHYATKDEAFYNETRSELTRLTHKFKTMFHNEPSSTSQTNNNINVNNNSFSILRDPVVVRNKGTANRPQHRDNNNTDPSRDPNKRKCKLCKRVGHNKQTCPLNTDRGKHKTNPSSQDYTNVANSSQPSYEHVPTSPQCYRPTINSQGSLGTPTAQATSNYGIDFDYYMYHQC